MNRVLFVGSMLVLLALPTYAQKGKAWTDWTQKEAEKVLNDSAWGQTQTEAGSSEIISEEEFRQQGFDPAIFRNINTPEDYLAL